MKDISKYTLADILKDINYFDTPSTYEYIESIVVVMKWHYEKQEFDNDIINKSQSKDIAVEDYILKFYKN
jgi:hypothetical protein